MSCSEDSKWYDLGRHDERTGIDKLLQKVEEALPDGPVKDEVTAYRATTVKVQQAWQDRSRR